MDNRKEFEAWMATQPPGAIPPFAAWQASSAHSAARIAELEGQVEMLVDRLSAIHNIVWNRTSNDLSRSDCMEVLRKCIAPSISIQTAEEYRKRVQAEALEEAARHIERFGKHVGWHHAAKDWPTDARQAIEIFSEHESAELMRMASELHNPAGQAEGKEEK